MSSSSYAWVLQDILGISFCISLIRSIRLPNLKVCTILLVLLLLYDIFFVFITPFFSAGKSVMVEVATGRNCVVYVHIQKPRARLIRERKSQQKYVKKKQQRKNDVG